MFGVTTTTRSPTVVLTPTRKTKICQFKAQSINNIAQYGVLGSPQWKIGLHYFMQYEDPVISLADIERWIKVHKWILDLSILAPPSGSGRRVVTAQENQVNRVSEMLIPNNVMPNVQVYTDDHQNSGEFPDEIEITYVNNIQIQHCLHCNEQLEQEISVQHGTVQYQKEGSSYEGIIYRTVCFGCRMHGRDTSSTLYQDLRTQYNTLETTLQNLPDFTGTFLGENSCLQSLQAQIVTQAQMMTQTLSSPVLSPVEPTCQPISSVEQSLFI